MKEEVHREKSIETGKVRSDKHMYTHIERDTAIDVCCEVVICAKSIVYLFLWLVIILHSVLFTPKRGFFETAQNSFGGICLSKTLF